MLKLSINDPIKLRKVVHALSSDIRLKIIEFLNHKNMNIHEIADQLNIPVSTAASNVKVLEQSGLILTELQPGTRGAMKVCSRNFNDIFIALNTSVGDEVTEKTFEMEMPIGQFIDCEISPTCGMANSNGLIITDDEPSQFFHPQRVTAQILWFRKGFVEYKFPVEIPKGAEIQSLEFSMEMCSEAPHYDHNWPSDITAWINDVEIGTWTCPGDFGDRRGKLNPQWWSDGTQYGMLKNWKVDKAKSSIDSIRVSSVTIDDLNLKDKYFVKLKIGIKQDATHKGGVNLFGKEFGDFEQDIIMKIHYKQSIL